ncbi:MAG TPA: gamma-glutamyltransferase family protein [Limnobacter sp.]|nr:gamma-glutamyltransferase family protein [Limnobacter sp.]
MIHTKRALGGVFVAPHHLAAQAGRDVLKEGGNAAEAMVAAAATIAVVYPHMNSIGGDGFWLLSEPGRAPIGIDACGKAAALATRQFYTSQGLQVIPNRGPLAALTVAGTVAGWIKALEVAQEWGGKMPTMRLMENAVTHAQEGMVVSGSQARLSRVKFDELATVPGFAEHMLIKGQAPLEGDVIRQPALATTLAHMGRVGLDDFYRGELAKAMAEDLARVGSPLTLRDLNNHHAQRVTPLHTELNNCTIYNMTPPTQGMASLMILGMFDTLGVKQADGFAHVHGLVESTKQAFLVRDRYCTDPAYMSVNPSDFLSRQALAERAKNIHQARALPWPQEAWQGDTIWMGCIDNEGRAASFIQSVFWEFGSGLVCPSTGVMWQNRGIGFSLQENALHRLEPGRKPFHTLNPAMARFKDGRSMVYGTMGGEGQPQTQAAIFSRYGLFDQPLQQAITAPRWLLGRTWGEQSTTLKLESRFDAQLVQQLQEAGHVLEVLPEAFSDTMGHAGAVVRHPNGVMEGAADPRSDGEVACC